MSLESSFYGKVGRTDARARRDHCHILVRDEFVDHDGDHYRYRCTQCGLRLKRKSGVMARESRPEARP